MSKYNMFVFASWLPAGVMGGLLLVGLMLQIRQERDRAENDQSRVSPVLNVYNK